MGDVQVPARLEQDNLQPAFRQLLDSPRARGSGADDDDVIGWFRQHQSASVPTLKPSWWLKTLSLDGRMDRRLTISNVTTAGASRAAAPPHQCPTAASGEESVNGCVIMPRFEEGVLLLGR
jgi:hypothetical protein